MMGSLFFSWSIPLKADEGWMGLPKRADVLVFAFGNMSRGDDGLGPLLLEQLTNGLCNDPIVSDGRIEFITDFQLQVEHILDLVGRRLVLFVDAHVNLSDPVQLTELSALSDKSYTSHAMTPSAVMAAFKVLNQGKTPPCFLLSIQGKNFSLGDEISSEAQSFLNNAVSLAMELCKNPSYDFWISRTTGFSECRSTPS